MSATYDQLQESSYTERLPPQIRLVITLMLVSAFVVILNETVMGIALPRLMTDLDISATTAQWLTTGYLLTMAVVIPVTGRVLERFSTRAIYVAAMSLFTAGTIVAAIAPGFEVLLAGRVVQASGTALILPLLMTTVLNFVPADRRGRMMGLITIVISVAPAIGPTISGLILNSLSWRWLFILVTPIAVLALVLGIVLVKNITTPRHVRFDVASIALSALGFGGLIFGLSSLGEASSGHSVIPPIIPLIVGIVALGIFVLRQIALARTGDALMNLRPFAMAAFTIPVILVIISFIVLFGSLILLPLYMQNVLGMGTLETGLLLLPGGLAMGVAAPLVGRLFDRYGPRPLVVPGAAMLSGAAWALTALEQDSIIPVIVAIHIVLSLGLSFMMTPLLASALGALPKPLYSHGSAIFNTLQQVAGAAGTALFITLMTTGNASALAAGTSNVNSILAGVHTAFLCGAIISLVSVVLSFFVRPGTRSGLA